MTVDKWFNRSSLLVYNLNLFFFAPKGSYSTQSTIDKNLACEQQTPFPSSLLSLRKIAEGEGEKEGGRRERKRSDDRKCVCCSQANKNQTSPARPIGINRLCSATFEQLLTFWATLCSTSNLGQLLPSLATFEQQIDIKPIQTIKGRFSSKDFIKTGFIKTGFIKTKDIQ